EPAKKKEFNELALPLILGREAMQCLVQFHKTLAGLRADEHGFIKSDLLELTTAFFPVVGLGVIYEDAPQHAGRHSKEMDSVLPSDFGIDEAHIRFVNQSRCSQRMVGPLRPQAI